MSGTAGVAAAGTEGLVPTRVFISYAHDDDAHVARVRHFWLFLRANGIDARLDLPAEERRLEWTEWMTREIRDADRIVIVASPEYRRRSEGDAEPDEGRGSQWEARLIRERINADQRAGIELVLPVLLPGGPANPAAGLPLWLSPTAATHYTVKEYTVRGAERLLRVLTGQPWEIEPQLGEVPFLAPRGSLAARDADMAADGPGPARPPLRTQLLIEARLSEDGHVASSVSLGGSLLCQRQAPLPAEVAGVWHALRLPPHVAGERVAEAGRRLAGVLFDDVTQELLAGVVDRLPPGDSIEVVLAGEEPLLSLPAELIRLRATDGESGPLGLQPGISLLRRPLHAVPDGGAASAPREPLPAPARLPGPLRVLAAVAAPDETRTPNAPLDVEAEMQAVLDAVGDLPGSPTAQVRILEVASLDQIRRALERDSFHVLHLSAHGSATTVELEDEDGGPASVTASDLLGVLRRAGRPVPLIVLSSCSGGSASQALAAGLIGRGADRVIAMLAPVTDGYATTLARHLYRELATMPGANSAQALARARFLAEEERLRNDPDRVPLPEYGVATLLAAGEDGPLVDPSMAAAPLRSSTEPAGGRSVRELPVGALIGRRAQLRKAMRVLRRDPAAVREFGAASGIVLTGIGGIGKTALAGRIIARLREDDWLIAVHEGQWNPIALIAATVNAIAEAARRGTVSPVIARSAALLADPTVDDGPKLAEVADLLKSCRLLVLFDDFEQNLTPGGQDFVDPGIGEIISALADACETGALLITCRHPLPGPDRFLVETPMPALSPAELRRMFLRLPALADLAPADQRLLMRTIGGHPRLIEFTDALLRGGRSSLRNVQARLRDLAAEHHIDLREDRPIRHAVDQSMVLGSADILLNELLGMLTRRESATLAQISVCRAPLSFDDLAFMFALGSSPASDAAAPPGAPVPFDSTELRTDVARLTDLTLLSPGPEITMHPWTAAMVSRHGPDEPAALHQRALDMRWRRFEQGRGDYEDLLEIPRHLAALRRYGEIVNVARQAVRILPGTLATVAYLSELCPLIPTDERAWAMVADLEYEMLLQAGNLPSAIRQLEAIHQQIKAKAAADPTDTDEQGALSGIHSRLGDVAAAAGDLTAARDHYQASLDITERLTATDRANTQWQRDLTVSHNRLGDIATAAGTLTTARDHYQAALDITERLTAADPANTQWQRDLAVSHIKLGDNATAAGNLTTARDHYQASHDITERLTATDPANAQWQRDLAVSRNKLGDNASAAGDLTAARDHYQASLDISERLAAADSANTEWQRDLAVSRGNLGDNATAAGDLTAARDHYQASHDITERLTTTDPANTQWQRDLSISHNKLGDNATAAGDLTTAGNHYQASLDIRTRLAAADPANTQWQRDLAVSRNKLGDNATAAGDLTTARDHYLAGLAITELLTATDPANTEWQRDLFIGRDRLGDIASAAGDLTTARDHYAASLAITERLSAADPANTQWQRDLSYMRKKVAALEDDGSASS